MNHDDSHDELPRISVGSMRVWLRIKSEFTRAVETKVDEYAAQNRLPEERRNAMHREAQQYAEETFKRAQHNIRINGRDFDSLQPHEQDAEPFDEALDRRIWALASNRLEWHRKIAAERREAPIDMERTFQKLCDEHQTLDAELDELESDGEDMSEDPDPAPDLVDGELLGQILAVTGELSQTIPSQQERSERSRAVEAEFKALKP
ncbi:hypothetical protein B0H15DRAFT_552193 [Mycena belliarum]|uniref:Uncharacterized protein n=1 Tax=Mycena belliarum TaxID=1033014 RepID=A0AAD6UEA7_9AGAR|nr:hypothetical protein B0H15DRAFT_552193 [Mycena belliae]